MDKITRRTLRQLEELEKDLRACQASLEQIGRAHVPVYFGVPSKANYGFQTIYYALHEMKTTLLNHPEIEG